MRSADYFDRAASYYPDDEAFVDIVKGERYDFRRAKEYVHRIANALRDKVGLVPGSKVAVYSPNAVMAYLAILAVNRADLVWLPINPNNSLETNIELLNFFGADCLIFHSTFDELIAECKSGVPSITECLCIDAESSHGHNLSDVMRDSSDEYPVTPADFYGVSSLNATGGTTGPSKGVQWTHGGLESSLWNFVHGLNIGEKPRYLVVSPMTHAAGVILPSFFCQGGATIILPGFDPETVLETIERERITHLFLPPTAIYVLLDHPKVHEYDHSSIERFICGSAPISPERFKQAVDVFGPCMMEAYGQTETHGCILAKTADDYLDADGNIIESVARSAGRPMLGCWVELMDEDGKIVGAGEAGEIVVRSSGVTIGYYNNAEATAEVSEGGWHHTTDIGVKDERGYITIVDRKKDMIISGGFNIYPVEVENVLNAHPAVHNSAVVGMPDEKWGEAVTAVVRLRENGAVDRQVLLNWCREKLGSVKTPKQIEFWDEIPLSPVGKVLKREVREQLAKSV